MASSEREIVKIALLSRAFLLLLILLWRLLGRPYDTSASLDPPCIPSSHRLQQDLSAEPAFWGGAEAGERASWSRLGRLIEGSIVWDSVYFVRIAQCSYEYEQTFAFLPVFPLALRLIAKTVLSGFVPLVGYRATLALSGYLLSNAAFVFSAVYFYRISCMVLRDKEMAFQSTALFCVNPASIFYASIYSESFFSLLSFAGMWEFLRGSRWRSAFLFGISGGIRSNGILHGGFLLFEAMHRTLRALQRQEFKMAGKLVCIVTMQTILVFAPFVGFQTLGFFKLCYGTSQSSIKDSRPWCHKRIPYLYGFVQSHYWDVGFLRYFQLKQLPNFLLASPMLSLAVWSIISFVKHRPEVIFSLGLCSSSTTLPNCIHEEDGPSESSIWEGFSLRQRGKRRNQGGVGNKSIRGDVLKSSNTEGIFSLEALPFVLEMAFMIFVACFVMHVQVSTRFLSICAPIYWIAAYNIHSFPKRQKLAYALWGTFFFYVFLGSLLFVNFYPFT